MKVQYIGTGIFKSEDGKVFYCDYGEYGDYVINGAGERHEITKRDKNDNPIEIEPISERRGLVNPTYRELVERLEKGGANLGEVAVARMMDIVYEETGGYPNWSDEAPEWVVNNCVG